MLRIAKEVGLHLVYKARFDQILSDGYQTRSLRELLNRMNVLDPNMAAAGYVAPAMPTSLWDVCSMYERGTVVQLTH